MSNEKKSPKISCDDGSFSVSDNDQDYLHEHLLHFPNFRQDSPYDRLVLVRFLFLLKDRLLVFVPQDFFTEKELLIHYSGFFQVNANHFQGTLQHI